MRYYHGNIWMDYVFANLKNFLKQNHLVTIFFLLQKKCFIQSISINWIILRVSFLQLFFSDLPVLGGCFSGCKIPPAVGRTQPPFVIFSLPQSICRGAGPKTCGRRQQCGLYKWRGTVCSCGFSCEHCKQQPNWRLLWEIFLQYLDIIFPDL